MRRTTDFATAIGGGKGYGVPQNARFQIGISSGFGGVSCKTSNVPKGTRFHV